jgi:hypothetical protein
LSDNSHIEVFNKSTVKRWVIPDEDMLKILVMQQNSKKLVKRHKKAHKSGVNGKKLKILKKKVKRIESKYKPLKFVEIEDQLIATQYLFDSSSVY